LETNYGNVFFNKINIYNINIKLTHIFIFYSFILEFVLQNYIVFMLFAHNLLFKH